MLKKLLFGLITAMAVAMIFTACGQPETREQADAPIITNDSALLETSNTEQNSQLQNSDDNQEQTQSIQVENNEKSDNLVTLNELWVKIGGVWSSEFDWSLFIGYDDDSNPITYYFYGFEKTETAFATEITDNDDNRYTVTFNIPSFEGDDINGIDPHDEQIYNIIYDIENIENGTIFIMRDGETGYREEIYHFAANTLEELYESYYVGEKSDSSLEITDELADEIATLLAGIGSNHSENATIYFTISRTYYDNNYYEQGLEYAKLSFDSDLDWTTAITLSYSVSDEREWENLKAVAMEYYGHDPFFVAHINSMR